MASTDRVLAGEDQAPGLVTLGYEAFDETRSGPDSRLFVNVRRAESVTFAARYDGEQAEAVGKHSRLTNTGGSGGSSRPWVAERSGGGAKLLRMVRVALAESGEIAVDVVARNDAGVDRARVRITLDECVLAPPEYPIDCEYRL